MYPLILTIHSIVRWLIIIAAVLLLVRSFSGWLRKRKYAPSDDRAAMTFTMLLDIQALLGLILYFFLAPSTLSLLNGSGSMSSPIVRYFGAEHLAMMVLALAAAHIGRAQVKKASTSQSKFRRAALWYSLSVLLILAAIPWPFLPAGRPWIRFG